MTEPIKSPPSCQDAALPQVPPEAPRLPPQDMLTPVQQWRDTGFSAEQQAALSTALLRVVALWTQQATRNDLQAEHQALEQHVAQQCEALRTEFRTLLAQHTTTLREELRGDFSRYTETWREELQGAFTRQADLLHRAPAARPRGHVGPLWVSMALLGLTCAGVLVLVIHTVLGRS